jgi:hypothetical protein
MVLCAALAACADGDTNRSVTAPGMRPVLSEAPADLGGGATVDGPFDLVLGTEAASAQIAAAPRAATGGRASGHVGLTFSVPFLNIASERYSFVALSTDPRTPFAAKGQYEMTLTTATGVVQKFHGDVICMSTVGNTTRIAGQLTKVWVNNVQRPINPRASHNIWTVTDDGEGQGTTDTASPMIFFPAPGAQFHCATGFTPPQFSNQDGNVQVRP